MATTKQARSSRRAAAHEPDIELLADDLVPAQRWTLIVTVGLCLVVFLRGAVDTFSTPKLTVVLVGTVALLALAAARVVRTRVLLLPSGPTLWVLGAFAAVLALGAVVNGHGWVSALGPYTRYEGWLLYACYVVVLLTVIRISDVRWLVSLATWLTVILAVVVLYGLLQTLRLDPFKWQAEAGQYPAFSTLGQENFAAGVVASLLPVALVLVLLDRADRVVRTMATIVSAGALLMIWRTNSFQGPVAAVVGAVPLGAVALGPGATRVVRERLGGRSLHPWLAGMVTLAVGALVVAPNLLRGSWTQLTTGTSERRYLWQAAWDMFAKHPILGNGFGYYARHFSEFRPAGHARQYGPVWSDAPHSVPLGFLVSGGVVLFAAWLAVVVLTGWCLVRGLLRLRGEEQLLLAAFGGAWLAYLAQSVVSIDVPPVAILQWLFAGAVIFLGGRRDLRIIGRGVDAVAGAAATAGSVAVALAGLVAAWFALVPLRADIAAGASRDAHARRDTRQDMQSARDAARLASWEPQYWAGLAAAYELDTRHAQALDAGERAASLDTGRPIDAIAAAGVANALNDVERAQRWYREAIRRDPHWGGPYNSFGKFFLSRAAGAQAVEWLRKATEINPNRSQYWADLGDAQARVGDNDAARASYNKAMALEPGNTTAVIGLHRLDAPAKR